MVICTQTHDAYSWWWRMREWKTNYKASGTCVLTSTPPVQKRRGGHLVRDGSSDSYWVLVTVHDCFLSSWISDRTGSLLRTSNSKSTLAGLLITSQYGGQLVTWVDWHTTVTWLTPMITKRSATTIVFFSSEPCRTSIFYFLNYL